MICHEAKEDISAFLDDEITAEQREALAAHLEQCPGCAAEKERLSRTAVRVRGMNIPVLEADIFGRVMAAIKERELEDSYRVFAGMLAISGAVVIALTVLLVVSPFGRVILAVIKAVSRAVYEVGSLAVTVLTRSLQVNPGWTFSVYLFLGFLLMFQVMRKVLGNKKLGGPLHE